MNLKCAKTNGCKPLVCRLAAAVSLSRLVSHIPSKDESILKACGHSLGGFGAALDADVHERDPSAPVLKRSLCDQT